ncbi:MAG: hypothetical protein ACREQN_04300 [Candidatus Binataceae bacterium]
MAGGNLVFSPGSNLGATIVNHGDISVSKGGLLAFVAPGVENTGVIRAPLGSVALGSGDAFTLDPNGNPLIQLVDDNFISPSLVDAEGQPLDSLVSNSGVIRQRRQRASGGEYRAADRQQLDRHERGDSYENRE